MAMPAVIRKRKFRKIVFAFKNNIWVFFFFFNDSWLILSQTPAIGAKNRCNPAGNSATPGARVVVSLAVTEKYENGFFTSFTSSFPLVPGEIWSQRSFLFIANTEAFLARSNNTHVNLRMHNVRAGLLCNPECAELSWVGHRRRDLLRSHDHSGSTDTGCDGDTMAELYWFMVRFILQFNSAFLSTNPCSNQLKWTLFWLTASMFQPCVMKLFSNLNYNGRSCCEVTI